MPLGPLARTPSQLLQYLGIKSVGRVLPFMEDGLRGTIDVTQFVENELRNTYSNTNGVVGSSSQAPIEVVIPSPAGACFCLTNASYSYVAQAAGDVVGSANVFYRVPNANKIFLAPRMEGKTFAVGDLFAQGAWTGFKLISPELNALGNIQIGIQFERIVSPSNLGLLTLNIQGFRYSPF